MSRNDWLLTNRVVGVSLISLAYKIYSIILSAHVYINRDVQMRVSFQSFFPLVMAAFMAAGCQSLAPEVLKAKAPAAAADGDDAQDEARLKDILAKFAQIEDVAKKVGEVSALSRRMATMPDALLTPSTCTLFQALSKSDYYARRLKEFGALSEDILANPLLEKFPEDGAVLKEKLDKAEIAFQADVMSGTVTSSVVADRCVLLGTLGRNKGGDSVPDFIIKPREFRI